MDRLEAIKKEMKVQRRYLFENKPNILTDVLWLIAEIEWLRKKKRRPRKKVTKKLPFRTHKDYKELFW